MTMLFRSSLQGNRNAVDTVSPHKLTLLVVIREYLEIKGKKMDIEEDMRFTTQSSLKFMLLVLEVMQGPDIELEDLMEKLAAILKEKQQQRIESRLRELHMGGIHHIMDYMDKLATPINAEYTVLNRNSVAGLFVRSMMAAFESLMFHNVANLLDEYRTYYTKWKPDATTPVRTRATEKQPASAYWSYKLAEQHLQRKAFLLEHCERAAGTPAEVRQDMLLLLKKNPDLTKTYYVDLLNSLRIKEYCSTIDSLHHYFDSAALSRPDNQPAASASVKKPDEDANRSLRYAALSMASVSARFGHGEQATAAVIECIRMAQEAGDSTCLQHATSWLNWLNDQNASCSVSHVDNAIQRSSELNLWQLFSLGLLTLAKQGATKRRPSLPARVLQNVAQSDNVSSLPGNASNSHIHVLTTCLIQKASLWKAYGYSGMASTFSQILLSLNTNIHGSHHMAEQECLALCLLANHHFDQAMYHDAGEILSKVKSEFPFGSQMSPLWMFTVLLQDLQRAIYHCRYTAAMHICDNVTVINQTEGRFRRAILFKHLDQYEKAVEMLHSLLDMCRAGRIRNSGEYMIRVLLEMGTMYIEAGCYSEALGYLLECSALCAIHHRLHLNATTHLAIGKAQLMMGMPDKAVSSVEKALVFLYSNGSLYDQAVALMLLVKSRLAVASASSSMEPTGLKNVLLMSSRTLNEVISKLKKIEAYQSLKEAYFLQAAVCNDLGYIEQRNLNSQKFRKLENELSSADTARNWRNVAYS